MDLACFYIPHFAAWALAHRWSEDSASGDRNPVIAACAHGRVLATTPSLRGTVAIGDLMDRARRLAPEALFLLRDPAVERTLWDHVLFRLYDLTPQVQPVPDPLVTSLRSGRRKPANSGCLYEVPATGLWDNGAWAMLQGPDHGRLQASATDLGACVGVSSTRSWAMLAAAYAETGSKSGSSGSVTSVPAHMIGAFLRQAPVALLETLRFDPDLIERLGLFGMRAVHHAIHITRRQLHAQFGSEGVRLFELLHPVDTEPPVALFDPCVLCASHDFDWPVFEPGELQPVLHHLLAQMVTRLDGRCAHHVEIVLHGRSTRNRSASRILKEPTARLDVLRATAETLLHLVLTGATSCRQQVPASRSVHRLSITFSGLTEVPGRQTRLFFCTTHRFAAGAGVRHGSPFPRQTNAPRTRPCRPLLPRGGIPLRTPIVLSQRWLGGRMLTNFCDRTPAR